MLIRCALCNREGKEILFEYARNEIELQDILRDLETNLTNGKGNYLILRDVSDNEDEKIITSYYSLNEIGL